MLDALLTHRLLLERDRRAQIDELALEHARFHPRGAELLVEFGADGGGGRLELLRLRSLCHLELARELAHLVLVELLLLPRVAELPPAQRLGLVVGGVALVLEQCAHLLEDVLVAAHEHKLEPRRVPRVEELAEPLVPQRQLLLRALVALLPRELQLAEHRLRRLRLVRRLALERRHLRRQRLPLRVSHGELELVGLVLTVAAGAQRRRLLRRRLGALRRAARVVALSREEGAVLVVHLLVDLGVLHLAERRARATCARTSSAWWRSARSSASSHARCTRRIIASTRALTCSAPSPTGATGRSTPSSAVTRGTRAPPRPLRPTRAPAPPPPTRAAASAAGGARRASARAARAAPTPRPPPATWSWWCAAGLLLLRRRLGPELGARRHALGGAGRFGGLGVTATAAGFFAGDGLPTATGGGLGGGLFSSTLVARSPAAASEGSAARPPRATPAFPPDSPPRRRPPRPPAATASSAGCRRSPPSAGCRARCRPRRRRRRRRAAPSPGCRRRR